MDTINQLTEYIKNFSLSDCPTGNQGYDRVLLQLFGLLGHGKSSFINTCKYVLEDGEYQNYANSKKSEGGDTVARVTFPLTETLTLVDNHGCSTMSDYETSGSEIQEIKQLLETARDLTEIFPIVVLTHKTGGNMREIKETFEDTGVERDFSLDNFTPEDHIKTRKRHEDVLTFFCDVIKDIKFRLERVVDPVQNREKRKKKVINFIYQSGLQKEKEELKCRK
ncbi:hypothetical protein XELAEV_18037113mg [Xenopus laevis]|uniref:Uncharacterized protein n=1 Tax=Xenopus laevis TaxID=8355 RepID=A0A974CBR6_XENLA|nr:hypothetical protein XELAEV_18037113mg [Xenopus laevis]